MKKERKGKNDCRHASIQIGIAQEVLASLVFIALEKGFFSEEGPGRSFFS